MKPQGPKKSPKRADLKGKNDPKGSYYKKLKTKDFTSVVTIERIMLGCLKIFKVDPPNFRICTYKHAMKVIEQYSKIYEN